MKIIVSFMISKSNNMKIASPSKFIIISLNFIIAPLYEIQYTLLICIEKRSKCEIIDALYMFYNMKINFTSQNNFGLRLYDFKIQNIEHSFATKLFHHLNLTLSFIFMIVHLLYSS